MRALNRLLVATATGSLAFGFSMVSSATALAQPAQLPTDDAPIAPSPVSEPSPPAEPAQTAPSSPYQQEEPIPFGYADFSWAPGSYGPSEHPLAWGPFIGEIRIDTAYHYDFNHPKDDTISGSSEVFRHNEVQVTQIGFGGDFFY
jgi:hypothetical protein